MIRTAFFTARGCAVFFACNGPIFNTYAADPYTVAHKTHRFGTKLTITNLAKRRSIRAVVTDRGPFIKGRCVDLGRAGRTPGYGRYGAGVRLMNRDD